MEAAMILSVQERFRPTLPTVMGNVDYKMLQGQLKRIEEILTVSGAEKDFVERSVRRWEKTRNPLEKITEKSRVIFEQHTRQAFRCNILRTLMGDSFRDFSCQLAGWPLLQRFCDMDFWGVVKVPGKSQLQRYSRWLEEEEMREVVYGVLRYVDSSPAVLGFEKPLDFDFYFADTTCVKTPIHFPVDWVLLRDAVRTLMMAVALIRKRGLRHRMEEPAEFLKQMNRLCIQMTHSRRKKNARKERKRILRLMKKVAGVVSAHAHRHRDLLDRKWEETDWTRPQTDQVLKRIDHVLELLPQAKKQAHERIIGERLVKNEDKILSLYETDTNVIVRGKAGAEAEFGNTLLLGETKQGVIVDWKLWQDSAPADSRMLPDSLARVKEGLGVKIKSVCGDRGFDSESNDKSLEKAEIYNGICPKDPGQLKIKMQEERFAWMQKRRSQTEGRVGIFQNQFLGRPLRVKGFANRELAVTWAILTHNLWVMARLPQAKIKQKAA
jgi:IS5 family transposase